MTGAALSVSLGASAAGAGLLAGALGAGSLDLVVSFSFAASTGASFPLAGGAGGVLLLPMQQNSRENELIVDADDFGDADGLLGATRSGIGAATTRVG